MVIRTYVSINGVSKWASMDLSDLASNEEVETCAIRVVWAAWQKTREEPTLSSDDRAQLKTLLRKAGL